MSTVEQIADAILYEGYILYPYRASALKNTQRWNFGLLYPPAFAAAQEGSDASTMQCECLARGSELIVHLRFLQLMTRDRLDSGGNLIDTWQEALTRDIEVRYGSPEHTTSAVKRFLFPAHREREAARNAEQKITGEIVRRQESIEGMIEVCTHRTDAGWFRISVRIANCGAFDGSQTEAWSAREPALCRSLVSTHAILRVPGGQFASLLDPPEEVRRESRACTNTGLWPVLVGDAMPPDTMLASPIILYDYPQIAPQSAGALFDGTEIDEILSLRILALTEDEKREMRETDPHTRRILERTEALAPEQWMQLHGVMREERKP